MALIFAPVFTISALITTRLAERRDVVPLAVLVERSFAAGYVGGEPTYESTRHRGWLEQPITAFRVGFDIERRLTPWDWCRHAQIVATDEDDDSKIVGFCEVWGEDAAALRNESAIVPQPVLFNVCVASEARRRGVGRSLLAAAEDVCRSWGDECWYLKVRADNEAACQLYKEAGWQELDVPATIEVPAWQERWKGSAGPVILMRKPLPQDAGSERSVGSSYGIAGIGYGGSAPLPAKTASEFQVTIETVMNYPDRYRLQALVWFGLLIIRNRESLTPAYRILPAVGAFATWLAYYWVVRVLSHPEMFPFLTGAVG